MMDAIKEQVNNEMGLTDEEAEEFEVERAQILKKIKQREKKRLEKQIKS